MQPPLYPSNRPATYFEHGDTYRLGQTNGPPQLFNDGQRFPSPNYNQHPSPFQLPTGRSQSPGQYYLNQAEFTSTQRQRFRPAFPHNFQLLNPSSTRRPDIPPQIHSVAYQNDPSKPETFLGQITLNNPDIDFLQSGRFKNTPFDGNSLKNLNSQVQLIDDDDDDNDNQDLFEHHRVTTYNPNKPGTKTRLNIKSNIGHIPHDDIVSDEQESKSSNSNYAQTNLNKSNKVDNSKPSKLLNDRIVNSKNYQTTTESKALLDLEPLLEDDIRDIASFRELMKNPPSSFDVQVIKANDKVSQMRNEYDNKYDSNPSASSMNGDNISKEMPLNITNSTTEKEDYVDDSTKNPLNITSLSNDSVKISQSKDINDAQEENDDEGEYVEYYDDVESTEHPHNTRVQNTDSSADIYDEYDNSEELEQTHEDTHQNNSATFDVVNMKINSTTVNDDNFQHFIDTTKIDQLDETHNDTTETNTEINYQKDLSSEEFESGENPSILGQEVVSVVTTKSVVNGTISIPDVTHAPSTTRISVTTNNPIAEQDEKSTPLPNTTENWVVVASVQTSRSVSGARFLPFPTVEQDEKKQLLSENEEDDESVTKAPESFADEDLTHQTGSSSTENINDKLDSIQSELSSGVFSGKGDKNIEHITETTTEGTTTTTAALNIFTLKSTQAPAVTEKSSPNPLPVLIKKFTHRVATTSTTAAPRKKPSLVTIMDDLNGFLPPGYKFRPSFKDKRTSTTTTTTTTSTTTKPPVPTPEEDEIGNGTQGRSSGITSKNKVVLLNDKSSLVPKDYKPTAKPNEKENIFKNIKQNDLANLLPPGYKPPSNTEASKEIKAEDILNKVKTADISQFLPKDYKTTTIKPKIDNNAFINAAPVNITALLPPGFKLNETESKIDAIPEIKIADISSLLPPGFKLNASEVNDSSSSSTKAPTNGFKVVFPSRPGAKPVRKTTTPKSSTGNGPDPVTPKIQKGWPIR